MYVAVGVARAALEDQHAATLSFLRLDVGVLGLADDDVARTNRPKRLECATAVELDGPEVEVGRRQRRQQQAQERGRSDDPAPPSRFGIFLVVVERVGVSDRFGRIPVIAVSLLTMMPAQWLLLHSTGPAQLGSVLLIGIMIGASFPVTIVLAQEAWPKSVGLASAMVMGLGWLPSGLGALVVGQIADRSSLTAGLATLTFVPVVGLLALATYTFVQRRSRHSISRTSSG